MTEPARLLLVGASGRVGRMVLRHWQLSAPAGATVTAQHRDPNRDDGLFWPLLDPAAAGPQPGAYDAMICLAGVTPGPGADLSLNTALAEAALQGAERAGIPRVLVASSSAVYGAGNGTPFSETSSTDPANAYGAAKLDMEHACADWRDKGVEVCCLRIGNVAGADALLLNVMRSAPDQPLVIDQFADGRGPVRSYIGARSMADVLLTMAMTPNALPEVLNIATPGRVWMEDLAKAAEHPFKFRDAPPTAHQTITLDCSRLAALHDFAPDAADPATMVAQWKDTLPR